VKGLIATALAAAAVALPANAAAVPCWKAVQNDWYAHGRVVKHYKLACYPLAIKKLPADVATYGGAAHDIRKAYLAEKARLARLHKKKH
jgi:hypothetical protein